MESTLQELAAMSLMKVLIWSAPAVLAGLLVGFMISLFQAVTQIQEQTLTFVPKIIAVFLVLLPFLVIDMVISNILLSLGMFMLPPVVISLPFKILLFVLAGGWSMVIKFIVMGFNY